MARRDTKADSDQFDALADPPGLMVRSHDRTPNKLSPRLCAVSSLVAIPIAFAGFAFLGVDIYQGSSEHDRLDEQTGIDLGIDRARDHTLDGRSDHHVAVTAHERDRAVAQRLGKRLAAHAVG